MGIQSADGVNCNQKIHWGRGDRPDEVEAEEVMDGRCGRSCADAEVLVGAVRGAAG
jgi:hypothetical protein